MSNVLELMHSAHTLVTLYGIGRHLQTCDLFYQTCHLMEEHRICQIIHMHTVGYGQMYCICCAQRQVPQ